MTRDILAALASYGRPQIDPALLGTGMSTLGGMPDFSGLQLAAPIDRSRDVIGTVAAPTGTKSIWDSFLSTKDQQGWGGLALGGASALMNAFMGMKQYGLAKDQLAEGRRQFDLNYGAQRSTVNSALEDRQRARIASNPGAYQSVGDYMDRYGIR